MRATRLLTAALTVGALAIGAPQAGATAETDQRQLPRRIELPRGWQPEGITTNGTSLFVGSLRHGGIWRTAPGSARSTVVSPGRAGRVAVGIDYDRRRRLIWVAGGPTGVVRAHAARSGRVVARYSFGSGRFINDLAVTRRGVYATDSFGGELAVVPLRRGTDRLPPPRRARTLELTGDFVPVADEFNLNGVVRARGWLLAVQSVNGRLFRINPHTGVTRRVQVTGARLANGDGLERRGGILYVVRNQNNRVVALDLDRRSTVARRVDVLRHRSLDVPTTAAAAQGSLWAVNARFNTPPRPRTRYWITRLPLADRR